MSFGKIARIARNKPEYLKGNETAKLMARLKPRTEAQKAFKERVEHHIQWGNLDYSKYLCLGVLMNRKKGVAWKRDRVAQLFELCFDMVREAPPSDRSRVGRKVLPVLRKLQDRGFDHPVLRKVLEGDDKEALDAISRVRLGERQRLSLVPVTGLPEEKLFIRTVQATELMFDAAHHEVTQAAQKAKNSTPASAKHMREANRLLEVATEVSKLTRLIPVEKFAAIRDATVGASAIQSKRYHGLYTAAEGKEGALWEALLQKHGSLEGLKRGHATRAGVQEVVREMHKFNSGLRAWKKTHLKLARDYIGRQPGTGGTDGAAYLQKVMGRTPFRTLHENRRSLHGGMARVKPNNVRTR